MDPLKLRFQKLRIVAPRINVQTTRFSEPQTTLLEERMHASASKNPQIHKKLPKVLPPPGIPIKDRLLSVLQPPISVLFGDNRLWLPFEPFPYQYEGIHFLVSRWSALLADEMGLGKTMQTILSLRLLLRAGIARTGLLVCPKPLVTNWMREFALWAEEIPVMVVQGDTWQRRNCWIHDRCPIKVANYESISRDEELFRSGVVSFDVVVLDEAQRIKNRDSKTASVVHSIRRKRSWALTGTPVENRAQDLFSILEFVHGRPTVDEDRTDLLRDAVSEVLLRRTKDMVMDDLPQKLIKDAYVDLGPAQRASYDAAEKEGIFRLNDLGEEVTIEHVFELIRVLKQICNFDPVTGESAKAERVKADLEEIASSGQKAILFSQWVETLEKLADKLTDFAPMLYHGKISGRQREQILREFREDRHRPLLMLSYGTGAVGLNLQYTNYVFLFDRWWNPAVEDQAINRAHRIGQKDRVFVSRMITPGTIEERVAEVLEKKRELFSFLIDDHDPLTSTGLSREDVFGLFDLQVGRREKRAA
ncbi:MAG: DEAD/DEAH box helicase [Planctomycetota bacterium]